MLPATPPASPTGTPSSSISNSSHARRASPPWATLLAAVLMLYALGAGWGLVAGFIPAARAYILMAVPCLFPAAWCLTGAVRGLGSRSDAGEQDAGLWLSGAGWIFIAVGFIAKYIAITRAQPDAYALQTTPAITPFSLALGVLCLLLGAAISWYAWLHEDNS